MTRLLFVLVLLSLTAQAQKQGNIWYFGNKAGLSFQTGSPLALLNGELNSFEGSAVISDSAGSLLFYSNGETVWNKTHQVMVNGTGIIGNNSSTQSSIIVPDPANSHRYYYLFTVNNGLGGTGGINDGLRYAKIDMCADSGRGEVMANFKNIKLQDSIGEKLAVVRHSNGIDYWVLTHRIFSNKFVALHLSAGGVVNTVISAEGSTHDQHSQGQMKISPGGLRVALASGYSDNFIDLFDFNPATGVVSNGMTLQKPGVIQVYGIEFSPDNSKLFAFGSGAPVVKPFLFQYNLTAGLGTQTDIESSFYIIKNDWTSGSIHANALQLGPDNKIYTPSPQNFNMMSVISHPNIAGAGCNFQEAAFSLGNGKSAGKGLPAFITNYQYSNQLVNCCVAPQLSVSSSGSLICAGDNVTFTATGAETYSWNTGNNTAQLAVTIHSNTTYTVYGSNGPGCDASVVFTQPVSACQGLSDLATINEGIIVFPNPAKNSVKVSAGMKIETIVIKNQLGGVVRNIFPDHHHCLITGLPAGLYHLSIRTASGTTEKRIVVLD